MKDSLPQDLLIRLQAIISENRYALSVEDKETLIQCLTALNLKYSKETDEKLTPQEVELLVFAARIFLKYFGIDLE